MRKSYFIFPPKNRIARREHPFVGGGSDSNIYLWDVGTGELLKTLVGHTSGVSSVTYSRDGTTLMSGSWDNTIRVWDVDTDEPLRTIIANITDAN